MTNALSTSPCSGQRHRVRLIVRGTVQGIGFRPTVWRLATSLSLAGWIANTSEGVTIEIEGEYTSIHQLQTLLQASFPGAILDMTATQEIAPTHQQTFSILPSQQIGQTGPVLSPDLATCHDCLEEIRDPRNRRYRYPFTTCAACGPRYSVARTLPYDRSRTTMSLFPMCSRCQSEYEDANDRRFHAETIACSTCGPQVELWDKNGTLLASQHEALDETLVRLNQGHILAVKGIGGFQLWVNALDHDAIDRLRRRKHRPSKPFAVLFASVDMLRQYCLVSTKEEQVLRSPAAPIVLLRKHTESVLAANIAPNNPYLGAMLPSSPLHHLLTDMMPFPVVATSGNSTDNPLVYDEEEALHQLGSIADAFLVHNRPIARPVDDPVVRIVNHQPLILRRARGFVPTPLSLPSNTLTSHKTLLAVGGHLKSTIALATPSCIIPSQHIGDLSTAETTSRFSQTVEDLLSLFNHSPDAIACDAHPDYCSTQYAKELAKEKNIPLFPVQHHHAHLAACLAEHGLNHPVLGVIWDGAGYGSDGTTWGGEFFTSDGSGFTRVGHLRPFFLPGGAACMKEPDRVAFSLLYEIYGKEVWNRPFPILASRDHEKAKTLAKMIDGQIHSPLTSSVGRLFDGVSALLDLCHMNTFEGEAAMALQFLAEEHTHAEESPAYSFSLHRQNHEENAWIADWRPLIHQLVQDIADKKNRGDIALAYHRALIQWIIDMAQHLSRTHIILAGGVFQNSLLLTLAEEAFQKHGLTIHVPYQYGLNDGGLSVGQSFVGLHSCV